MKARVLIAKALAAPARLLFLRRADRVVSTSTCAKDMWQLVSRLREGGVTVILTTHYIERCRGNRRPHRRYHRPWRTALVEDKVR